ncbi:hypothetical protein FN846DRAFT_462940 [Sphaerosporella brunnea]|uniref:Secreted protein n=1 Tax=Sphaerosporella brunnea TaxID=1250544 RepID=A0A5J5EG37_9PEZI|nr:hypothetical protein FN846DRAFT_462940 [Sphaerosporella brunnea]
MHQALSVLFVRLHHLSFPLASIVKVSAWTVSQPAATTAASSIPNPPTQPLFFFNNRAVQCIHPACFSAGCSCGCVRLFFRALRRPRACQQATFLTFSNKTSRNRISITNFGHQKQKTKK